MLSPIAKPTLLPGAILCKSIPHSEIKNKMSSTERHVRGAQIEKKPRAMLIDYSQNAFPQSNNEVRAWDGSPEQRMETSEKLACTHRPPCLRSIFKAVLQSTTARVSPEKNPIPFPSVLLPFKWSSYPKSGSTSTMCIMVSVQHSSVTESLGMGRRVLLILGRHSARDTGRINNALWRFQTEPTAGAEGSYFNPQLQVTGTQ